MFLFKYKLFFSENVPRKVNRQRLTIVINQKFHLLLLRKMGIHQFYSEIQPVPLPQVGKYYLITTAMADFPTKNSHLVIVLFP